MLPRMTRWYEKAKAAFRDRDIPQKAIADTLCVTEGAVSHYLSGRREPPIETIRKLAAMLDMSLSELVEGDPFYVSDPDEQAALAVLRRMPPERRATALRLLETLAEPVEKPPTE